MSVDCEHMCTSNCRREGCNCECGEFHITPEEDEQLTLEKRIEEAEQADRSDALHEEDDE